MYQSKNTKTDPNLRTNPNPNLNPNPNPNYNPNPNSNPTNRNCKQTQRHLPRQSKLSVVYISVALYTPLCI